MLVFGDKAATRPTRAALAAVEKVWRNAAGASGLDRHALLISAFIAMAELVQGLGDAAFDTAGFDELDPATEAAMRLLEAVACEVMRSWDSGFEKRADARTGATISESFRRLHQARLPEAVTCKEAEGYAFYALYPETYALAARRSGLGRDTLVIGLRSIGTGLAAMVAAELGARAITLRPHGDPYAREVRLGPRLVDMVLCNAETRFAIVDEGPGLSGSSFGCVADWLEDNGVAPERIHVFPGHDGPLGPAASARHRDRWAVIQRHVVGFDEAISPQLSDWMSDLIPASTAAMTDISGGHWRAQRSWGEGGWPAANIQQERRKFLFRTPEGDWLARFAGLGEIGERKLRRARRLAEAGLAPAPKGLRHGFLIERWHGEARLLQTVHPDRAVLTRHVGHYLGVRAKALPAATGSGASLRELLDMATRNISLALGQDAAEALERFVPLLPGLESCVRRVETDNRMHAHEWLVLPDGSLLKADAVDHCEAHDLIGCQDIAWDIAGAAIELSLTQGEVDLLCGVVAYESGRPVSPAVLAFMLPCYAAFQLGAASMAAGALAGTDEAGRLRRSSENYACKLRVLLECQGA